MSATDQDFIKASVQLMLKGSGKSLVIFKHTKFFGMAILLTWYVVVYVTFGLCVYKDLSLKLMARFRRAPGFRELTQSFSFDKSVPNMTTARW